MENNKSNDLDKVMIYLRQQRRTHIKEAGEQKAPSIILRDFKLDGGSDASIIIYYLDKYFSTLEKENEN